MKLHVFGGCGAWPAAGQACSGYLVESEGFRLLIDPGYATLPRILEAVGAEMIDAVLVSHGHPDHCADLHPLLRARVLGGDRLARLPVHTLPHAIDRVLSLDRAGMLDDGYTVREFAAGDRFEIGPFRVDSWLLPHFVPNAGLRLEASGRTLAYTGDSGPSPYLMELARSADLLLAEATFPERVPADSEQFLSSAGQAGEIAARAGVRQLVLTHLWPGTDRAAARSAASRGYDGTITIANPGLLIDIAGGTNSHAQP